MFSWIFCCFISNINLSKLKPTRKPSLKGKVAQRSCDGRVSLLPYGEGGKRSEPDEGKNNKINYMKNIICI